MAARLAAEPEVSAESVQVVALEADAHAADAQDDSPQGDRPPASAGTAARKRPRSLTDGGAQSAATAAYRAARESTPDLARSLVAPAQALADLKQQPGPTPSRKTREKAAQRASRWRSCSEASGWRHSEAEAAGCRFGLGTRSGSGCGRLTRLEVGRRLRRWDQAACRRLQTATDRLQTAADKAASLLGDRGCDGSVSTSTCHLPRAHACTYPALRSAATAAYQAARAMLPGTPCPPVTLTEVAAQARDGSTGPFLHPNLHPNRHQP